MSSLYAAARTGHRAIVELLLSKGADASICSRGISPADIAEQKGHQGIAQLLKSRATSIATSSIASSIGPLTSHARTLADDETAAEERATAGGTEDLRRVEELSRQVQGLGVSKTAPESTCDMCGVSAVGLKRCPSLAALYCSAECQKQAWPSHKAVCPFNKH